MSANGTDAHFDAIVVGSGFGGSVTAYRLAEAGKRVCVLERGRPYPPGSFTRSPYKARESFWDPARGLTGMYHYWSFRGIDALVSAGLGGGSLIYANVFLRKDERWFVDEDVNDGGYESAYGDLDAEAPARSNGRPAPLTRLTCDPLILSAGTLGTTNLLLRNRSAFPRLSRKLGTRFCGNGDLLTLAINCGDMVDGRRVPRIVDPGYGPVITSTARMPDALDDGGEG